MRQYFVAVFIVALFASVCIVPTALAATFNISPEKIQKPIIRTLDSVGDVGKYTSIAVGRDGNPVISYYDVTNADLKFIKCGDAICTSTTIRSLDTTGDVGQSSSMVIGRDGYPVIAYFDKTNNTLKIYHCTDSSCSGGTTRTLDSASNASGSGAFDIAVGSDMAPVVSYYSSALKLYKCDNLSCSTGTARSLNEPSPFAGYYSSIAIGVDGYPVLSYQDASVSSLKFYKCSNAICDSGTASTLYDDTAFVGDFSSITIGRGGNPIISYQNLSWGSLEFYACNNVSCTTGTRREIDDPSNSVGRYTSTAIGIDGNPIIVHWDQTAKSLKLHACMDSTCSFAVKNLLDDTALDVGSYTSSVLLKDGYPVISYYDATNGNLKFAYVGARVKISAPKKNPQLVGYWNFNEGTSTRADDISGNKNHGTLTNGPMWATGRNGRGVRFDGADDYVTIPSVSSIDNLSAMTLSAWVYPSGPGENSFGRILHKGDGAAAPSSGWLFAMQGFTGIRFSVDFLGDLNVYTNESIKRNQWSHVAVTWTGSLLASDVHIYINGKEATYLSQTDGVSTRESDGGFPVIVGNNSLTNRTFDGIIDEVRIYNGILSADEIRKLYQEKATVVGSTQASVVPSGLVGYWSFNGPDVDWLANKAKDRSGQGNDGAIINMSTSTAGKGGRVGQGFRFNAGGLDRVNAGSPVMFDDIPQITVATWVKLHELTGYLPLVTKGTITGAGWALEINGASSEIAWSRQFSSAGPFWISSDHPALHINEWMHIAVTYDKSSVLKTPVIYLNGQSVSSSTSIPPSGFASNDNIYDLVIGNDNNANGATPGTLDEVRIYNRILSASEIKALYNAGK